MPWNRSRLVRLIIALVCCAVLTMIAAYALWARLTRQPTDPRRAALDVQAAADPATIGAVSPVNVDLQPRDMPRIEPGTVLGKSPPPGWSHLVLHGTPRAADGDVRRVSAMLARLVSLFHLTILADVARDEASHPTQYKLRQVALGLATDIEGHEVIVSSKGPAAQTAHLGVVERSSLAGNEANLDQALQLARTPTMLVFDATAVVRRDGKNVPVVERHAVLVAPAYGRLSTLVWVLGRNEADELQLLDPTIRLLDEAIEEDRKLYVDASQFVLGLPAQEAFALVGLPAGRDIPLTDQTRPAIEHALDDADSVVRLENTLRSIAHEARDSQ